MYFEKGIKPVKANKFYYFKHPMAKKLAEYTISHNNIEQIDRGVWRKFNPYNPWVEDKSDKEVQNLKVESLDDLFEDDFSNNAKMDDKPEMPKFEPVNQNSHVISPMQNLESSDVQSETMSNMANSVVTPRPMQSMENSTAQTRPIQNKMEEAPVLPMEPNNEEEELFSKDLQDELEAKFDELFGPIDED